MAKKERKTGKGRVCGEKKGKPVKREKPNKKRYKRKKVNKKMVKENLQKKKKKKTLNVGDEK